MGNRLYRSETNRTIAGVCGGLGEFLNITPLFVRIFFILWGVLGGSSGVFVYFVLWVLIPNQNALSNGGSFGANDLGARFRQMTAELGAVVRQPNQQVITYAGIGLIGWGAYQLLRYLGINVLNWDLPLWAGNITLYIWPLALIFAGVFVLARASANRK